MLAKGAFIYITGTYNYHQHLYHRRGGKTLIRAASLHTHDHDMMKTNLLCITLAPRTGLSKRL